MDFFTRKPSSPFSSVAAKTRVTNAFSQFGNANYKAIIAASNQSPNANALRTNANAKAVSAKNAAVNYANAIARESAQKAINAKTRGVARTNASNAAVAANVAKVLAGLKVTNSANPSANNQAKIRAIIKTVNNRRLLPTFVGTTRVSPQIRAKLQSILNATGGLGVASAAVGSAALPTGATGANNFRPANANIQPNNRRVGYKNKGNGFYMKVQRSTPNASNWARANNLNYAKGNSGFSAVATAV